MAMSAVIVAVVGWLASHVLAIRAQRKAFVNQLKDEARLKITESLREYGDWLAKVRAALVTLHLQLLPSMPQWTEQQWIAHGQTLIPLFYGPEALRWQFVLEEHELLFSTRRVFQQLSDIHNDIGHDITAVLDAVITSVNRPDVLTTLTAPTGPLHEKLNEQTALLVPLGVHLQNVALGQILGTRRRIPAPRDVSLPRLVVGRAGPEYRLGTRPSLLSRWRRSLSRRRLHAVLEEDLPEQRELFNRIAAMAHAPALPIADCWIHGWGKQMSAAVLDFAVGTTLWQHHGTPDEIVTAFDEWQQSQR